MNAPKIKLTDFDSETLRQVAWRNIRARDCNGVRKQSLNRLVKKGMAAKFKGAFGEDEWTAVPALANAADETREHKTL